jgi:nitrogen fixation protein
MYLVEENAGGKVLDGTYYLIRSDDKMYAYCPKRKVLESRNPFAFSNEFDVFIPKLDLEEGVYELIICKYNNGVPTYSSTDIVWNVRHGS